MKFQLISIKLIEFLMKFDILLTNIGIFMPFELILQLFIIYESSKCQIYKHTKITLIIYIVLIRWIRDILVE